MGAIKGKLGALLHEYPVTVDPLAPTVGAKAAVNPALRAIQLLIGSKSEISGWPATETVSISN